MTPIIDHDIHERETRLSGLEPMSRDYWQWLTDIWHERASRKNWRADDIADLY